MLRRAGLLLVTLLVLSAVQTGTASAQLCSEYDEFGRCVIEGADPGIPVPPPEGGEDSGPSTFSGCTAEAAGPPPGAPPPGGPWAWVVDVCYVASVEVSRGAPYWGEGDLCDVAAGPLCGAPPPDPRVVARRAIASISFVAPAVVTAPPQGSPGTLVGLPVWMWVDAGSAGPVTASATDGPVTVNVTARVVRVDWDMGDGVAGDAPGRVSCGLGTPYPGGTDRPSPDCGYRYERASSNHVAGPCAPNLDVPGEELCGGPWAISATSTWEITWTGGGMSGAETLELTASGAVMVRELYVLNRN